MRPLNLLLLLSEDQSPKPEDEMLHLAEQAERDPHAWLADVLIQIRRVGHQTEVIPGKDAHLKARPREDQVLIRALVKAHRWRTLLESGDAPTVEAVAKSEGVTERHVRQMLPVGFLAPDLSEAIVEGRQPPMLTLAKLLSAPIPIGWREQRALFAKFAE